MSKLVISLTTIPSRMHLIAPTLRDLLAQTADVAEIRLNIPHRYRRFPDADISLPNFPKGITVVRVDKDYGPATKVLPTVQAFAGQDVDILFCDDDQHYEPGWAARFCAGRAAHPNACIVENGYDLPQRDTTDLQPRARRRPKDWRYRVARLASGLQRKPSPYLKSGYVDIFQGYRGAMIRPDSLPTGAFDIPDVLWTVDDIWLSGQLTQAGVPLWLIAVENDTVKAPMANAVDALQHFTYKAHDRLKADASCISYFQRTYGIWQSNAA